MSGRLLLRQASALWAFKYEVIDAAGQAIGSVDWPNLAQAKNARLRWHEERSDAGDVCLTQSGRNLRYRLLAFLGIVVLSVMTGAALVRW